jgi:predicted metalloprotease with PDZ domain
MENLGGLAIADEQGRAVAWERDPRDPWRILTHQPADVRRLRIDLTYIANQPSTNSVGVDIESSPRHALLNWNCVLLHPEDAAVAELPCAVAVRLPEGWDQATALPQLGREGAVVRFAPLPLAEVIDRPLLAGARLQHLVLRPAGTDAEVMLHVAAQREADELRDEAVIGALRRLPGEAEALFGGSWFARFDMLLRIGDAGPMGLEHGSCSVNGVGPGDLSSLEGAWSRELMPHEFVHSWVGKHRRPLGMLTPSWQQTPVFDGLWVYEGLTELLGRVLAVRCGLLSPAVWRATLAGEIESLAKSPGRRWRSLRDTCRCSWQLRGWSPHHADLRRGQDYYIEGALFWLMADRRIRATSGGSRSLDDFCRSAFGPRGVRKPGFTDAEIVSALAAQAPDDWNALIARWIDGTGDLDAEAVLGGSGWRLDRQRVAPGDPVALALVREKDLREASGLTVGDGWIRDVVAGSPAARVGLQTGDFIFSADGVELKLGKRALTEALITDPPPIGATLYVHRHETWFTVQLALPEGIRITTLVREEGKPDGFAGLLAPRVATAVPTPAAPVDLEPAATPR